MKYLYENATIYLDRKYEKFKEICYIAISDNIGESCDGNTEITKESKESLVS